MNERYFVRPDSIVREIWGKSDTILFIFAGAAAEFSLNKAVDWLYYTGKLPANPIARLFSTVEYARQIIFFEKAQAHAAIDRMRIIHTGVESNRGYSIPDWAYRDVLYMLIYYSISSFELLERRLSIQEKQEIVSVFIEVGTRMGIQNLPSTYDDWRQLHEQQLNENLCYSDFTEDLFKQYKKHLGLIRYDILLKVQSRIAPKIVLDHLKMQPSKVLPIILSTYKYTKLIKIDKLLKSFLLPKKYAADIMKLDTETSAPYNKKVANP